MVHHLGLRVLGGGWKGGLVTGDGRCWFLDISILGERGEGDGME